MRFGRTPIKVADAQQMIAQHIKEGKTEYIPLAESFGRFLAEEVVARHDVPHFRRSGMDGFAVRSAGTKGASREDPVLLEVAETIPCGAVPEKDVRMGTAARVMTGAAIPEGADAVVMIELTDHIERDGKMYTAVKKEVEPGENVSPVGMELREGTPVLERGRRIGTGEAALLATFGYESVPVYRRPTVAIFATGSELLDVGASLQPGKIRNSNSIMLASQVASSGALTVITETLPDDVELAKQKVLGAFDEVDVIMTIGGVSVGDYDILVDLFEQWDGEMFFNKVAMRPGSPTTVGMWRNKFLFALSGNPGACFVGYELFARPVLRGMQGSSDRYLPTFTAYLGEDYPKPGPFQRFVRGFSYVEEGKVFVKPAGVDKSGITLSIKDSDCLIDIPPGERGVKKGELVTAHRLHVMA